jgi:hypothetical protein
MRSAPGVTGFLVGTLFSISAGAAYFLLLHEPGSLFYPFAALAVLGGPLVAGTIGSAGSPGHRGRAFFIAGSAVLGTVLVLFIIMYAVLPQAERTSVLLPDSCTGFSRSSHPAPALAYDLPGNGTGVLVAGDEQTAVVAVIDYAEAPYPAIVCIVNRSDNRTLRRMDFPDDTVIAAIDGGIVYLYHDKRGYLIDARNGAQERTFLIIDNYGGLSAADRPIFPGAAEGRRYLETTAVISSWSTSGTVRSRSRLAMNGIAYNCLVRGKTGEIVAI